MEKSSAKLDSEIQSFVLSDISRFLQLDGLGTMEIEQIVQEIRAFIGKHRELILNQQVPCESTEQSNEQKTQ